MGPATPPQRVAAPGHLYHSGDEAKTDYLKLAQPLLSEAHCAGWLGLSAVDGAEAV